MKVSNVIKYLIFSYALVSIDTQYRTIFKHWHTMAFWWDVRSLRPPVALMYSVLLGQCNWSFNSTWLLDMRYFGVCSEIWLRIDVFIIIIITLQLAIPINEFYTSHLKFVCRHRSTLESEYGYVASILLWYLN